MKNLKQIFGISIVAIAGLILIAADHIDAPAVAGGTSDITDFYAFQGEDTNNLVFVANVQGLLSPSATANASFDEDIMVEFNIDNTGDNVEDLVIQAIARNGKMYILGPVTPTQEGTTSTLTANSGKDVISVAITPYGQNAIIATKNGISVFAGPRDDPFFFDFARFTQILTPGDDDGDGMEETEFLPDGLAKDTFAGSNVMSIVVEVPKSMIGGS